MEIGNQQSFVLSYQYQEYTQVSTRVSANTGDGKTVDSVSIKSEIFQFRLEVLFNSKDNIGKQATAINIADLVNFETTPPEFHLGMVERLTPAAARQLVSKDGYYGIDKTSQRLADFVLQGGGDDLARLKAGREGIIRGFKEAEKMWGGTLPDMSYTTLDKALEQIDQRIRDMGGSVVDLAA